MRLALLTGCAALLIAPLPQPASGIAPVFPGESIAPEQSEPPAMVDVQTWRGKQAFETRCARCHSLGAGRVVGPDLAGVTLRRTDDWLARWLRAPELMLGTDESARALMDEYGVAMPNPGLSDPEVSLYIRYFHWFDARPAASTARRRERAAPE